jgi:hypothetical protein
MNFEEYESKVNIKKEMHKRELYALHKEYAFSNNNVEKGDIICGNSTSIKVDTIKWALISYRRPNAPECVYFGVKYTKSGKPFKSGERDSIYQANLKSVNGEPAQEPKDL